MWINGVFKKLHFNLDKINFFLPKEKRSKMLQNLRNIFYKMDLSDKETRILSSVFASLSKKRVNYKLFNLVKFLASIRN